MLPYRADLRGHTRSEALECQTTREMYRRPL